MITEHQIHFKTGQRSKKLSSGNANSTVMGKVPRIAKMMALAIHLDHLIKSGQVTDQAELARFGQVSRARLTQIMNLLYLAPDIQEEILFLSPATREIQQAGEIQLREIASLSSWGIQRKKWSSGN